MLLLLLNYYYDKPVKFYYFTGTSYINNNKLFAILVSTVSKVYILQYNHYHQSVLLKGRSFTQTQEPSSVKSRSSTINTGTKVAVLLGMNRSGSFPLLSAPHSLFSIWTHLKRSEKFPGAPTRRWGEWIWLTGPSGLHRNSAQGLNISSIRVFNQIRDPEIPITLRPRLSPLLFIILLDEIIKTCKRRRAKLKVGIWDLIFAKYWCTQMA